MLEVRYNKTTKELTGWWGSRFGNHEVKLKNRPDETMAMLNIPILTKPMEALLFDETTQSIVDNPDYVEPEPVMDYKAEILKLQDEVKKLKGRD